MTATRKSISRSRASANRDRFEARVFKGGGPGSFCHGSIDGAERKDESDTSPELSLQIEGGECGHEAQPGEPSVDLMEFAIFKGGKNGLVSQLQQKSSLFRREFALRECSSFRVNGARSRQRHRGQLGAEAPASGAGSV